MSAGQWSFMFRDVIVGLRKQFRCLTFDFPGSGLSPGEPGHDHSLEANARILEGFIDVLDLQDITMVVHDAGGLIGFLTATRWPERFRALVISNTFGWPLAGYPAVRRMLQVVGSPPFGAADSLASVVARFTASRYGVGRQMSRADRRAFLGPWRSRGCRRATRQVLAGLLRIDPVMATVQQSLQARLAGVPVLTCSAQERSLRLAGPVRADLSPRHRRRHSRRTPLPVQRRPGRLQRRDSAWWTEKVATTDGASSIS